MRTLYIADLRYLITQTNNRGNDGTWNLQNTGTLWEGSTGNEEQGSFLTALFVVGEAGRGWEYVFWKGEGEDVVKYSVATSFGERFWIESMNLIPVFVHSSEKIILEVWKIAGTDESSKTLSLCDRYVSGLTQRREVKAKWEVVRQTRRRPRFPTWYLFLPSFLLLLIVHQPSKFLQLQNPGFAKLFESDTALCE